MSVNKQILEYLRSKGVSQANLAEKMGVAQSNLNRLLNSDDIKVSQLIEICKVLNLNPGYFFNGNETINNQDVENYKKRIKELEYLVNLNKRAEIEKYFNAVNEILNYHFPNLEEKIKDEILESYKFFMDEWDGIINKLALEVSAISKREIKRDIEERLKSYNSYKNKKK